MTEITRDSIVVTIITYLKFVTGFGGIVVFSRVLPPSELGTFFLFQGAVSVTGIVISLGIDKTVEKKLSEDGGSDIAFNSGIVVKSVTFTVLLIGILIFHERISAYLGIASVLPVILYLAVDQSNRICKSYHKGKLNIIFASVIGALDQILWVTIGIGLVYLGWGYLGIIFGLIFSKSFATLILLYKIRIPLTMPSYEDIVGVMSFSKHMYISSLGGELYNWVDILILGIFVTSIQISGYELAWKITTVTLISSKSIGTALFPHISQLNSTNSSKDNISSLVSDALIGSSVFVVPAFFGVIVISEELISYIFGQQYVFASVVLIILMSEKVVHSIHEILGKTLLAIGEVRTVAEATTVNIVLNIILNFILINEYGIVGAAVATSFSHIINTMILYSSIRQKVDIKIPLGDGIWMVGSSLVMGIVVYLFKSIYGINSVVQLSLFIGGAAILYVALLSAHPGYRRRVQSLL